MLLPVRAARLLQPAPHLRPVPVANHPTTLAYRRRALLQAFRRVRSSCLFPGGQCETHPCSFPMMSDFVLHPPCTVFLYRYYLAVRQLDF